MGGLPRLCALAARHCHGFRRISGVFSWPRTCAIHRKRLRVLRRTWTARSLQLTPEEAMRIQGLLGSDIAMQLDVCPPGSARATPSAVAAVRTHHALGRALPRGRAGPGQVLFGIIQGGTNVELRLSHTRSAGEAHRSTAWRSAASASVSRLRSTCTGALVQIAHRTATRIGRAT